MDTRRGVAAVCWLTLGLLLRPAPGQGVSVAPDADRLAARAAATAHRLATASASWHVAMRTADGVAVHARVLWTAQRKRWRLSLASGGQRTDAFEIIERDGLWYAIDLGRPLGKYRPFEAPFSLPTAYLLLGMSDASPVDADLLGRCRYTGTDERGPRYLAAPHPAVAEALRRALGVTEDLARSAPPGQDTAPLRARVDQARRALEGTPVRVDPNTGLLLEHAVGTFTVSLTDFQWLGRVGDAAFDTGRGPWPDHAADPTEGVDPNDLAMICRNGAWRVGMPGGDFDNVLIDLRTGRFRRVPFRGPLSTGGCFLKGRTRVVVSAMDGEHPGLTLHEVDLRTGANRRLGGELLRAGICLLPALSPDGKTIAVLHNPQAARPGAPLAMLESRVCLVDVASGRARHIGQPLDTAYPSWLPDGKGLVLITRKHAAMDKPSVTTLVRMDLDGRVTPLRAGDCPFVLPAGRIVFEDGGLWRTCGLDGRDATLLADGMKGYGFPSPGPLGKRVLWMQFARGRAPRPVVVEMGATKAVPVTDAPGLWSWPAWR